MAKPFFAQLLEEQIAGMEVEANVKAGARGGLVMTLKAPSDNDEGYYTLKHPSDSDEGFPLTR